MLTFIVFLVLIIIIAFLYRKIWQYKATIRRLERKLRR
jgi:cell division protein FtsL